MLKLHCRLLVLSALLATTAQAADLALSPVPLALRANVAPNIMLVFDDSASMRYENSAPSSNVRLNRGDENERLGQWEYLNRYVFPRTGPYSWGGGYNGEVLTGNVPAFGRNNFYNYFTRNSRYNPMFYNPDIEYKPWYHPDGIFGPADPTATLHNVAYPYPNGGSNNPRPILHPGAATTIDLTAKQLGNPPDLADPPTAGWLKIISAWASTPHRAIHTAENHHRTNVLVRHDIGCDYSYRNYGDNPTVAAANISPTYIHNDYDGHHTHAADELVFHDNSHTNYNHGDDHGPLAEEIIPRAHANAHSVTAHTHGSNDGAQTHRGDHHHNHDYWPITYYTFHGSTTSNSDWRNRSKYKCVSITGLTPDDAVYTSPNGTTRTKAQEVQNFANWYQYYRTRLATAKAAIGHALSDVDETGIRLGYGEFNIPNPTAVDGVDSKSVIAGVREFTGADRTNFFNSLYAPTFSIQQTRTREAVRNVGEYFKRTDDQGPWSDTPGEAGGGDHSACRRSYNVVVTDGLWGGYPALQVGNVDGTAGILPDGTPYLPVSPFGDLYSNTVADVAMKYWREDLRPDLDNQISPTSTNSASWQHMTNIFISFGLRSSSLTLEADVAGALAQLQAGSIPPPFPWGNTWHSSETPRNIARADNILHAALNSRGASFNTSDLTELTEILQRVISEAKATTSSAGSLGLNVATNNTLYQALFNSADWTGQLLALPTTADGTVGETPLWDAAEQIPAANSRIIITYDGTNGQPFRWNAISQAQRDLLVSEDVLNYLRGDQSGEQSRGGNFRNRNSLLGDIINSSPVYVGAPSAKYPDSLESVAYSTFKAANATRQPMLYVGANDGFLHGFKADTGEEVFAYAPAVLMNKLPLLTDPDYAENHQYFVDETPVVVDAFFDGSWHSVLMSGLRGGGQGMFALDVTDPDAFLTEAGAKSKVLWEFTDSDDRDLGFTYGEPSIVRLNPRWTAIFSGGYNNTFDDDGDGSSSDSTTGDAVLYGVDIGNGNRTVRFNTQEGKADDPTGNDRPNGLSTPSLIDVDGDFRANDVYAGDLFGNVWRMGRSSPTPRIIYTACSGPCTATNRQPITTQLQVVEHPNGGRLVLFGTGKYIETGDVNTAAQTTQSFYAIWDNPSASASVPTRADLLEQEINGEVGGYRTTTANHINWSTHKGWYIDLTNPAGAHGGERQISGAVVSDNTVIFTTITPSGNLCDGGGTSWLMVLNAFSGSRPVLPVQLIDENGAGIFAVGSEGRVPASGKQSTTLIRDKPTVAVDGGTKTIRTLGADGSIQRIDLADPGSVDGRRSWQQLDFR